MRATTHRRNTTRTAHMLNGLEASLRYGWATLPIIAAYIVVVYATLMWFEPSPVAKYYRTVSKLEVYPGEEVMISATVTRSKGGCDSIVTRTWTDGDGNLVVWSQFVGEALPEGPESYTGPAIIPPHAPLGPLWLQTEVEFMCNPVQRMLGGTQFPLPDILFNVRPKTTGGDMIGKINKEAFAGSYP